MTMVECQYVRLLLGALIDEELSPGQHKEVQAHLDTCPDCQADLEQLCSLSQAFGELRALMPTADVEAGVADVRARIAADRHAPGLVEHLQVWWHELVTFHRPLVYAGVLAVVLALAVPLAWLITADQANRAISVAPQITVAPSMVESIEYGGESVIIMQDPGTGNTIIWLQSTPTTEENDGSI